MHQIEKRFSTLAHGLGSLFAVLAVLLLWTASAHAQCAVVANKPVFPKPGGGFFGLTSPQWASIFGSKADANNGVLCNTVLSGSINLTNAEVAFPPISGSTSTSFSVLGNASTSPTSAGALQLTWGSGLSQVCVTSPQQVCTVSIPAGAITSSMLASGAVLKPTNNLSDVTSASTARTNLGLGSLATLNSLSFTGLSGVASHAQLINVAPVNVLSLGADNTGATDNTSIIQSACTSGASLYFPAGNYKFTSTVSCLVLSGAALAITGDGSGSTYFIYPSNSGLALTMADQLGSVKVSGISFIAGAAGGGTALTISQNGGASAYTPYSSSSLTDIQFKGATYAAFPTAKYWGKGIQDNEVSTISMFNIFGYGCSTTNLGPVCSGTVGIELDSTNAVPAITINMTDLDLNWLDNAVIFGGPTGVATVSQSVIQFCNVCIYLPASGNAGNLFITNSTIASTPAGGGFALDIAATSSFTTVSGNQITSWGPNAIGINAPNLIYGTITDNQINGTSTSGSYAMSLGRGPLNVSNNLINEVQYGIAILSGTTLSVFGNNNCSNTTVCVSDASGGANTVGSLSPFGGGLLYSAAGANLAAPSGGTLGYYVGGTTVGAMTTSAFKNYTPLYEVNGSTPGVTCSGTPTSSFASVGGLITHC